MADAVGISMQEFEQLQQQIFNLRSENYELQTKNGRYAKELYEVKQKLESVNAENQRLTKIVARDKGAKEFDKLVKENERLQQQEADFQLQCQTLMGEITQLSSDKDLLSQSVEQYRQVINSMSMSPDEIESMRNELAALREECNRLKNSAVPHQTSINESDGDAVDNEKRKNSVSADSVVSERESILANSNDAALLDLKMQIASMQNERKLLLSQLDECKKQVQVLQKANNDITATAEEKQRAYEQILSEKEALFSEMSSVKERCSILEDFQAKFEEAAVQLRRFDSERKEIEEKHFSVCDAFQADIATWKEKFDRSSSEVEKLTSEFCELKQQLDAANASVESATHDLALERIRTAELETNIDEQTVQLTELEKRFADASQEIVSLNANNEQTELQIVELHSTIDSSNQECADLRAQVVIKQSEIDRLTDEFTSTREQSEKHFKDLEEEKERCTNAQSELKEFRSQKEAELEELRKEIQLIRQNAQEEVLTSRRKDAAKVKDLQRQLKTEKRRVEQLQERLEQLFQQNSNLNPLDSSPHHLSGLSAEFSDRKSEHDFETSSVSSFSFSNVKNALFGNSLGSAPLTKTFSSSGAAAAAHNSTPSHSHVGSVQQSNNDMISDLAGQIAKLNLENDRLREKISYLESTSASMADDLLKKQQLIDHYLMGERSLGVSPSVSMNSGFANMPAGGKTNKNDTPAPVLAFKSLFEKVSSHNNAQVHGSGSSAEETKRLRRAMEEILTKNMSLEADLQRLGEENVRLRTNNERTSETSNTSTITH